jgi:hypothetical protein
MAIPTVKVVPIEDLEVLVPFRDSTGSVETIGVWRGDHLDPQQGDGSVLVVLDFAVEQRIVRGTDTYEPSGFTAIAVQRIDADGALMSYPTAITFKDPTESEGRSATGGIGIDRKPVTGLQHRAVSPQRPK